MTGIQDLMDDVAEFHRRGGVPVRDKPQWIPDVEVALRRRLIVEEVMKELIRAIDDRDLEGVFDGCIDSIYVIVGLMVQSGLPAAEGWRRVQGANLAKYVWDEAEQRFTVYKDAGGKVTKPPGWERPDMYGALMDAGWDEEYPEPPGLGFCDRCGNECDDQHTEELCRMRVNVLTVRDSVKGVLSQLAQDVQGVVDQIEDLSERVPRELEEL